MRAAIFAFFLGCSSLLWLTQLPSVNFCLLLFSVAAIIAIFCAYFRWSKAIPLIFLLCGVAWAILHAQWQLQQRLPPVLEDKKVLLIGQIVSLPEPKQEVMHFEFVANKIIYNQQQFHQPKKLRLSWYQPSTDLHVGETWQLWAKLKAPRSTLNPGEFDFARWLFEQQIGALGYVIDDPINQRLKNSGLQTIIQQMREYLTRIINDDLKQQPLMGFITALVTGSRNNISNHQWQVLQATGTNHLIAIAGLHIGLVASFAYFVMNLVWRRLGRAPLYLATPYAAAIASLLAAIIYSALAGFALPTQRAVVMISVFLLSTLLGKNLPPWHAWFLALGLSLAWNPLSILADSFWLSFGAVACILYSLMGRCEQITPLRHWLRLQWSISIGLIPLTLLFFHQVALVGIIANAIAIPWVGFVVLPFSLIGSALLALHLSSGHYLLLAAAHTMNWLWPILQYIAQLRDLVWLHYIPTNWILLSLLIAVFLLLTPPGIPGRWLSPIFTLPLLLWQAAMPAAGTVWFTLLDVGQGLSAVVRTQHHTLVYDAGMKYSDDFDMGSAVVVPYLRHAGLKQLDTLVISHADLDHRGGAASILKLLPPQQILTSVPQRFADGIARLCQVGQQWTWDTVHFEVIYPPLQQVNLDNDSSCVLRISSGKQHILLTGDIEAYSEHYLLQHKTADELATTIMVAPHHGSKTSSTVEFIQATHPQIVLFPVGYHNRFHFPHKRVLERYQNNHVMMFDTATDGAITLKINSQGLIQPPALYRKEFGKYWD